MSRTIERLHYITQPHPTHTHWQLAALAFGAGCRWVQLRIKGGAPAMVAQQARRALEEANAHQGVLIVNDYPEVAQAVGAHGVHLGWADMPPSRARELLGPEAIIGGTANTLLDILRLVDQGVDYIGLGPFRFTATKQGLSPVIGLEGYRNLMAQLRGQRIATPVIAIGGIEAHDVQPILSLGLHGVAVSGAITGSGEVGVHVRQFLERVESAGGASA